MALANRLAGWFVAMVLILAVMTFAIWSVRDPSRAWDNAIALLIVTCPCALALATPLAVTIAVGRAARAGIFLKGGDALELLSRTGTFVLDKTGTLTEGRTALVEWVGDTWAQPLVLALESGSSHPLADGFRRAWPSMPISDAGRVVHHVGGGITGVVAGQHVVVGSPKFVAERAVDAELFVAPFTNPALTPVLVAVDGVVVAAAGLGDRIRDDALASLTALRARGWRTVLLSGDDPVVAAAVGAQLGFARPIQLAAQPPNTSWRMSRTPPRLARRMAPLSWSATASTMPPRLLPQTSALESTAARRRHSRRRVSTSRRPDSSRSSVWWKARVARCA